MKSAKDYGRIFLLAVLAGGAIGIGGIAYLSLSNKVVGALMFTVGLYTICIHGLNLFTGKVGYLAEQPPAYLADLAVIWLGNWLGTWLAAMGAVHSRIAGISEAAGELCSVKVTDSLASLFLLGIFCGALMYIAVEGYKKTGNPVILFACVATFILSGFEHCIADMFYFSAAGLWSADTLLRTAVITVANGLGGVLIPLAKKGQTV